MYLGTQTLFVTSLITYTGTFFSTSTYFGTSTTFSTILSGPGIGLGTSTMTQTGFSTTISLTIYFGTLPCSFPTSPSLSFSNFLRRSTSTSSLYLSLSSSFMIFSCYPHVLDLPLQFYSSRFSLTLSFSDSFKSSSNFFTFLNSFLRQSLFLSSFSIWISISLSPVFWLTGTFKLSTSIFFSLGGILTGTHGSTFFLG